MLTIRTRRVDDAVILYLDGRITLGEECRLFRVHIRDLLASGNKKLVLNLRNVEYIDSSGLGELVSFVQASRAQKATLKLTTVGRRFRDVLQCSKLFAVFEIHDSIREAIMSFGSPPVRCLCPICGGICGPAPLNQSKWKPQECINCGASFEVIFQGPATSPPVVRSLKMTSYLSENDYADLRILSQQIVKIGIVGRLDLFTFTPVRKAWFAIPKSYKMMISLIDTTEISRGGLNALLSLVTGTATGEELFVSLDGLKLEQLRVFPAEFRAAMKAKLDGIDVGPKSGEDFWALRTVA
jgi:anti-sigma B factor antagonist